MYTFNILDRRMGWSERLRRRRERMLRPHWRPRDTTDQQTRARFAPVAARTYATAKPGQYSIHTPLKLTLTIQPLPRSLPSSRAESPVPLLVVMSRKPVEF